MIQEGGLLVSTAADMREVILHGLPVNTLEQPVRIFYEILRLPARFAIATCHAMPLQMPI